MKLPQITEINGIRVLTTKQIAEAYGTDSDTLKHNFAYNRKRYVEGKHFISIEGAELKAFKARYEILTNLKFAKILYLWTEKGALLHAKSLNTDKAWEVYDYLVDFYFRAKEEKPAPKSYRELRETALAEKKPVSKPATMLVVNVPENPEILGTMEKIQDTLTCMKVMLAECNKYLNEEEYKERRNATAGLVGTLIGDVDKWLRTQHKLVEKHY